MNVHSATFAIAAALLFAVLLGAALLFLWRARTMTSSDISLQSLLAQLEPIDRKKIAAIAHDQARTEEEAGLENWQIWELTDGLQGLERMASNCDVLIQLAFHLQQWYPEAVAVAEQLRLNTREIQWHLDRLRGAEGRGNLRAVFPDYAQRAVTIYYGMTQAVLRLYEASQLPLAGQLESVF